MALPAAILDLDGTLVDTNYQHALCWYRAFRDRGITIPIWRLHRHVGMGGDLFVAAVAGDDVEREHGDELRDGWESHFDDLIDEAAPLEGARELIATLHERGHEVVLATSSVQKHFDHFLELLDVRELVDGWTTKDDVEAAKPEPDLVQAALAKVRAGEAVMVGDSPWDVEAARRAGIDTICVVTGGFSEQELREAGAVAVCETLAEVGDRIAGSLPARR